jgi:hypothetical protein
MMAELSKDQLNELVNRATTAVFKEMQGGEAAFGVADLRAHLSELGKASGAVAWEISYKTSSASLTRADLVRPGGPVAWEISYKTSSVALPGIDKA